MPQRKENQTRFSSIKLKKHEAVAVDKYFLRTTLLWNYLVSRIGDEASVYMNEEVSEISDQYWEAKLSEYFNEAMSADLKTIDADWRDYVESIRKLPTDIQKRRLEDLVSSYKRAKLDIANKVAKPSQTPKLKKKLSSQSFTLAANDFEVRNKEVFVSSVFPFSFTLPQSVSANHRFLMITRRAVSGDARFGPSDSNSYVVTFFD